MGPAAGPPTTAPPPDPVTSAVGDPDVGHRLEAHALAILGRWLAHRPRQVRVEAASDAVQETFARAMQGRRGYDSTRATPIMWLHGILNKVLIQKGRELRRGPCRLPSDPGAWGDAVLVRHLDPAEGAERLDAGVILAKLTPDERDLLSLRYRDGLGPAEVAARLGISPVAARVRLFRALTAARVAAGCTPGEGRQ